jgi:hypothetical protein
MTEAIAIIGEQQLHANVHAATTAPEAVQNQRAGSQC